MKNNGNAFEKLTDIIAKLRDPQDGCPWDKEQTHQTLKPYLIEECYETIDAIEDGAPDKLCAELGDVLLQVVLHAQIASDSGEKKFGIEDVCNQLSEKLIRRHPHIFSDTIAKDSKTVLKNWEKIKEAERGKPKGALSGVPQHLPGLLKAQRIGEKTARLGFDWSDSDGVQEKVAEELKEIKQTKPLTKDREEEFGDLLFTLVQWARFEKIDAEEAMRKACAKFIKRFAEMENLASKPFSEMSYEEKEELWGRAKEKVDGNF
jgi:tetrapyrrole methylase family protein/MazG family protein